MNTTKKIATISPIVVAAAREYLDRRDRISHPEGRTDNGGRWYPSDTEDVGGTITRTIRSPSRAWPWSYMVACRTAGHVAELYGVDASAVRSMARTLDRPSYPITKDVIFAA
jgi:hypothetical protein